MRDYENKYKDFVRRLADAKANGVSLLVVSKPEELGENYEEIVESLNRIAAADLNLAILPPNARVPRKE